MQQIQMTKSLLVLKRNFALKIACKEYWANH